MQRPRIGIPLCLDERGRWREGRDYLYIDDRYARSIEAAGGLPIQLPIQSDAAALAATVDGLLLPGGDDFPSDRALPDGGELDLVPARQREFDAALMEAAQDRALPILGICYGMQLLARESGATLEPHLPSSEATVDEHRLPGTARHAIEIAPDSRLATILGPGAHDVNSLHHQAVLDPGPAWRTTARAPDGVIEAIERAQPADRWEIGVQWHPEKMSESTSGALFRAFVDECRACGAA